MPEVEYAFRNPLTQEAVYKTILLKRRRAFHLRVAEALETLYPNHLDRLYGLLTHHFALAGQRTKAIDYLRKASRQAIGLYAYDDAVQNLHTALELAQPDEKNGVFETLCEELGDAFRLLRDGERAIAEYQRALGAMAARESSAVEHSLSEADRLSAIRLHRKIVQVVIELKWTVSAEHLRQANESRLASRATLEAGLAKLMAGAADPETVQVLTVLSTDAWRIQEPPDWEAAQRSAQAAVDTARQLNSALELSQALGALANVLDGRSLLREHLAIAQQRLAVCETPDFTDAREHAEAQRGVGAALMYVGEYEQAIPYLREAGSLALRTQAVDQQANALGLEAQCWFRLDRWDDVLSTESKWRDLERRFPRERVGET